MKTLLPLLFVTLMLGGCASLDGGIAPVQQAAEQRLGQRVALIKTEADEDRVAARVAELLREPLSADTAVQLALLNHRGLQASLHGLGLAEAERLQAARLPNPGFSFGKFRRGGEREIERSLGFDLARLLALPLSGEVESRQFAARQQAVVAEMLALAGQARKAFVLAVAAEQSARYAAEIRESADAGAELARRLAQAGNWSALQQAREHRYFSEAALGLARAEQAKTVARERLVRALGLWGEQVAALRLPERLPDLPAEPADRPDIEQQAMASRLDVQAARLQAEASAKQLGLSKVTRFINVLEFGVQRNTSNEAPRQTGYEIRVELPLFDWGDARIARAESLYMQSVQRAAQTAVEARSEVREAYLGYRSAWDIARHYRDDVVPTAQRISEETLLRYNGMLVSVFELLADARSTSQSVRESIEALRDFWLAQADLDMALVGKPTVSGEH